jgi:peptidylprolyl isomerase
MQTNKIIIPTILAVLICVGGYWLFTRNVPKTSETPADNQTGTTQTQTPATQTNNQPVNNPTDNQKIMNATLHTSMGDITIEFNSAGTPNTVANFIKLAQSGFYDGTKFHRVIKGFMDQGGDPFTKDDSKMADWGKGGPGYKFDDELTTSNRNDIGTIAMANSGPNTNGSQFFINAAPNNFLDTKHVVFGKVIAGMDVVTAINNTPTDSSDRPITPVVIKSITLK